MCLDTSAQDTDPMEPPAPESHTAGATQTYLNSPSAIGSEQAFEQVYRINQMVLDDAVDGIYGLDGKGLVTFVNPAAQRMTGWSLEDLKGRPKHGVIHHSHADGSHYPQDECPIYQSLQDGQKRSCDKDVFWRKDGTSFPVAYTSTPVLRHGSPCGAVIVFRDVTHRMRERAWQQSKAKLRWCIAERRSLRETVASLREALSVLVGSALRSADPVSRPF